jgi:hypothetical protein
MNEKWFQFNIGKRLRWENFVNYVLRQVFRQSKSLIIHKLFTCPTAIFCSVGSEKKTSKNNNQTIFRFAFHILFSAFASSDIKKFLEFFLSEKRILQLQFNAQSNHSQMNVTWQQMI